MWKPTGDGETNGGMLGWDVAIQSWFSLCVKSCRSLAKRLPTQAIVGATTCSMRVFIDKCTLCKGHDTLFLMNVDEAPDHLVNV